MARASDRKTPTQRLAERELATEAQHEALYDYLAGIASDRVLPAVDEHDDEGREAA